MFRAIGRSRAFRQTIGSLMAGYLNFVRRTNRIIHIPGHQVRRVDDACPSIITFWHGQHLMQTFFRREHDRCYVMISRHGDGEINAIAVEKLGMLVVRGSGAQRPDQVRKRGGIQALRQMLALLAAGDHVSMTADVPKVSRVAGDGIITLAQLSGRPIIPIAVVCSRRIDFRSWDAASLGLPFGTTIIIEGEPISIGRDDDDNTREQKRQALEQELDRIYALGYATLGSRDPGADRPEVKAARAERIKRFESQSAAGG